MARVRSIFIDPDRCTCSQACVFECPEVLDGNTWDGVPVVREGAQEFFETHIDQIRKAAYACPVEAVILEIEGD